MTGTLFIGNLSYFCTEADVQPLFKQFGTVHSVIIRRTKSDEMLYYGFVQMDNLEQADQASHHLDGQKLLGRPLRVMLSKSDYKGQAPRDAGIQVHVSFLSSQVAQQVDEQLLDRVFSRLGHVTDCVIKQYSRVFSPRPRQCGYGYVYFADLTVARNVIGLFSSESKREAEGVRFDCKFSRESESLLRETSNTPFTDEEGRLSFSEGTVSTAPCDSEGSLRLSLQAVEGMPCPEGDAGSRSAVPMLVQMTPSMAGGAHMQPSQPIHLTAQHRPNYFRHHQQPQEHVRYAHPSSVSPQFPILPPPLARGQNATPSPHSLSGSPRQFIVDGVYGIPSHVQTGMPVSVSGTRSPPSCVLLVPQPLPMMYACQPHAHAIPPPLVPIAHHEPVQPYVLNQYVSTPVLSPHPLPHPQQVYAASGVFQRGIAHDAALCGQNVMQPCPVVMAPHGAPYGQAHPCVQPQQHFMQSPVQLSANTFWHHRSFAHASQ